MQDYDLPFCYVSTQYNLVFSSSLTVQDNYTTNYFLPGGSYGQVTSGNYTSSDGATGNLLSGEYTMANGTIGNIYGSSADLDKPITAALPLPTQYTAAGSGSAIPATALGQEITYTSTIPGTTISPSVVSATISTLMSTNGSTTSALVTKAASTIPGTTVTPHTTTVTTMVAGSPTESGAADCFVPKRSALLGATLVGLILRHVLGLE